MNKLKLTLLSITLLASASGHGSDYLETDISRLLSPTFEELTSELMFDEVHTYRNIDAALIEQALDEQFYRIQFFSFSSTIEEDCQ